MKTEWTSTTKCNLSCFWTTHFKQLNTINCFRYQSLSQFLSFIIVKLKKSCISCSKHFSCVKWCVGLGGSYVTGRHAGWLIQCSFKDEVILLPCLIPDCVIQAALSITLIIRDESSSVPLCVSLTVYITKVRTTNCYLLTNDYCYGLVRDWQCFTLTFA